MIRKERTMGSDEDQIRELLAARDAAIAAGDAEAAVAAVAPGAITYDLPPPLSVIFERDAAVAALRDWFATWEGPVRSDLTAPTVLVSGDLAVAHGLARMQGVKQGQGAQSLWFRVTIVFERGSEGWRVVHEHNSVPMKMDGSGAAATDLTPDSEGA